MTRTWAPQAELVALAWALAVAAGVWAALSTDPPGRVLLAAVALFLVAAGLYGTLVRPRLAADQHGLTVRGVGGTRAWPWAEVNVRLVRTRRLGRETTAIEIDADNAEVPDLVVLGWLDLGADPRDVVDSLLELRT
ncbi:hypothetical protein BLA60_32165 [Actinophytocola xinjiangensis]|uniref:Low molecular weight protein antigen 6 PH domain-containing protein n=1 Tax=Actinophytocola xinjiangensis TaxID=485602 RepID=A0A7Z0WH45_9PSEU|nr:hypothetical protein BLA60_32165 [Actinophytocola xinjiangensis]